MAERDDRAERDELDEFYVGYLPNAPRGIGGRTRVAVLAVFAVGVAVLLLLLSGQAGFAPSRFEFGVVREFRGVVRLEPHPVLLVERPSSGGGDADVVSQFVLVSVGKFGAREALAAYDGRAVELDGSLIYRDGRTMVEIADGTVRALEGAEAEALAGLTPPAEVPLGDVTLVGEIVDSKCFWGVMKPGNLKPHRACAVRCISGGVPPVFLVRDATGRATQFLLVGPAGQPVNDRVLHMVAEPLEVTGRATRLGELLVLYADPATYRRL